MTLDHLTAPLVETRLPGLTLWRRGKVRDVYDLGDRLLVVATDRLSAFDVVLPTGIPGKGVILTQLSLFWFRLLGTVVPHHVLAAEVDEYPAELRPFRDQLEGRSMLVVKTEPLPVECVVRGYLAGSGWKDYRATGAVCGIPLPPGLREADRLEPPLFTPATKAESGHDENIPFAEMARRVGTQAAAEARDKSLAIYARARAHAEARGIILADTKFEFGSRGRDPRLGQAGPRPGAAPRCGGAYGREVSRGAHAPSRTRVAGDIAGGGGAPGPPGRSGAYRIAVMEVTALEVPSEASSSFPACGRRRAQGARLS